MSRVITDINSNWGFSFESDCWETVDLPHTWNFGEVGSYRRGTGKYCKKLILSVQEGRRLYIEFDGANIITELWVNDSYVGKHEGGYSRFRFDITDYVIAGENRIDVSVNNTPTAYISPIDDMGDFTKPGGIYRSVRLVEVPLVHIAMNDYGSSGVYISTNGDNANVFVKLEGDCNAESSINVQIFDGDRLVSEEIRPLRGNGSEMFTLKVSDPILWNGVKNPHLYTCVVKVGEDEVRETFGFREYYIDPDEGFFLNGEYVDLHGVNYHQDSCEAGWAMTDEQRERDFRIMRELGCNIVRMAHYQHCKNEYDICDRLGITVWTEVGIVNKMQINNDTPIDPRFFDNAKAQLIELIRQNYNHPSVIVWGIFNELWQMSDEILSIFCELNDLAKKEDPSRLTTYADCQFRGEFLKLPTDVIGLNRYFGWYKDAGPAEEFGRWLDSYKAKAMPRGICVSEYGGGGAVSQHKDNIDWENEIDPWGQRHYENYQSEMHEKVWSQFNKRKWLWSKIVWCMFDFSSAGRCEGDTVGINDKGLCTRERLPKDAFYFYKSQWSNQPMVHLCDKRFVERADTAPIVKVYSNVGDVELFVNGISFGKGAVSDDNDTVYTWENVALIEGENMIEAAAVNDEALCDGCVWIGHSI